MLASDSYIKRFPSQLHGYAESKWCVLFYAKLNILRLIKMSLIGVFSFKQISNEFNSISNNPAPKREPKKTRNMFEQ